MAHAQPVFAHDQVLNAEATCAQGALRSGGAEVQLSLAILVKTRWRSIEKINQLRDDLLHKSLIVPDIMLFLQLC